jgi:hypothetical protein
MRAFAIVVFAALVLAVAGVLAPGAFAEPLKYLGKYPDQARGVIEQNGVQYDVQPGTDVPGWGQVQAVGDESLVIDHHLSDAEKDDLRTRGAEVYDISRVRVPREDLKVRFR